MRGSASAGGSGRTSRGVNRVCGCVVGMALGTSLLSGCATGAYQQAERAAQTGDWPTAIVAYERALVETRGRADVRIALTRAKLNASRHHHDAARALEERGDLAAALGEYQMALEHDPSNGQTRDRIGAIEVTLQDRSVRSGGPEIKGQAEFITLDPASRKPLSLQFSDASLTDILDFIGRATGVNVVYDPQFQDRSFSVRLDGVTLEEALDVILTANEYFYKVLTPRAISVTSGTRPRTR